MLNSVNLRIQSFQFKLRFLAPLPAPPPCPLPIIVFVSLCTHLVRHIHNGVDICYCVVTRLMLLFCNKSDIKDQSGSYCLCSLCCFFHSRGICKRMTDCNRGNFKHPQSCYVHVCAYSFFIQLRLKSMANLVSLSRPLKSNKI